jgi:DNA-directed RNA polymerase specialized sigma24 family protein
MEKKLMTIREYSKKYGIKEGTVRVQIHRGKIKTKKIGSATFIIINE